uniref:p2C35 n=1 Tax=Arundo donax TaxID=35708 RepID=A0A0A9CWP7_ARUDO
MRPEVAAPGRGPDMSAASRGPERNPLSMGPERNPPPAGAQIGPDGNLGTGCSGTAANDSELSNPDDAAAADEAADSSGSRRSTEVESGVDTLALRAAPEMARNVVGSSAAAASLASATRSSVENGTTTLSGLT